MKGEQKLVARSKFGNQLTCSGLAGCLTTDFLIPPATLVALGPITGVTQVNYTLAPLLNMTTAILNNQSKAVGGVVSIPGAGVGRCPGGGLCTEAVYSATSLSKTDQYWIGLQHNDSSSDSSYVYFRLDAPIGKFLLSS